MLLRSDSSFQFELIGFCEDYSVLTRYAYFPADQLGNPRYVENAPQSLVDEVTNQVAQWEADISNYQAHLAVLADLVDQ